MVRYWLLAFFFTAGVVGQTITSPTGNPTWTGWTGNAFTVGSVPIGTAMVCYTVDAHHATNPASGDLGDASMEGALYEAGCSNSAPFSFTYNSFWQWNGNHQVTATAYDIFGNILSKSSPAPYVVANPWPVTCTPILSVTTSISTSSNWSGRPTITGTVSGCAGDTFNWYVYVDGIQQTNIGSAASPQTLPLDTTRTLNGPHNVALEVYDTNSANYQRYSGPSDIIQALSYAGEWSAQVNFSNTSPVAPAELWSNWRDSAPISPAGGTTTLAPIVVNTDGTTVTSPTFYFYDFNTSVATISASSGSSITVTGVSQGSAKIGITSSSYTGTDATTALNQSYNWTSPSYTPRWSDWGNLLWITGGSGCNVGPYQISSVDVINNLYGLRDATGINTASFAAVGSHCSWVIGPYRTVWANVASTNTLPNFGNDGVIRSVYTPGKSTLLSSTFSSSGELLSQLYPTPYLTSYCNSGYTALETGIGTYTGQVWDGSQSPATFTTSTNAGVASQTALISGCPRMMYVGDASNFNRLASQMYTSVQGGTAQASWNPGGLTGVGIAMQAIANSGKWLGITIGDEVDDYTRNPLQGPIQFGSASGSSQNWLISATCNGTICTALTSASSVPGGYFLPYNQTTITGSSISGMNTPGGSFVTTTPVDSTHFTWPSSAPAGTYCNTTLNPGCGTNDAGFTMQPYGVYGWFNSNTDYLHYDDWARLIWEMGTGTGTPPYWASLAGAGATNPYSTPQWTTLSNQSITINGTPISNISLANDLYWTHGNEGYNGTQGSYNVLVTDGPNAQGLDEGTYLRQYFGYTSQTAPRVTITQGTPHIYAYAAAQYTPIASCLGNVLTFSSPHYITVAVPGLTRLWGTNICGSSGTINLVIDKILSPTSAAVSLSQSVANKATGSYNGCSNCGTLTFQNGDILSGSTGPTYMYTTNSPTSVGMGNYFAYGGSATDNVNHHRGQTFTMSNMSAYILGSNSGPFTITTGTNDRFSVQVNGGATQTVTLTPGSRTATQIATDIMSQTTGVTALDNGGGALRVVANVSGTTSTLAIVTASADATLGFTGGASSTATQFNTGTYIYAAENLPHATDNNGSSSASSNYFRELPNYSCTSSCGSANIMPDNLYVHGRNVGSASGGTKEWTFLTYLEAMILKCAGVRLYKQWDNPQAYTDHTIGSGSALTKAGWTGSQAGSAIPVFNDAYNSSIGVLNQHFTHPTVESGYNVPAWHAGSMASMIWSRWASLIFQPALNGPDYGLELDCTARGGSNGDAMVCGNFSNGPQTRTFNLSPYLQSGQTVIRQVANSMKIITATISAGTASDTITLQAGDSVWYLFPATYAGTLTFPTMTARLADVPGATGWAVSYGYDSYTLDAPTDSIVDCGAAATCNVPIDLKMGQPATRLYRIIYYGSSHQVLAKGDVETL